MSLLVAPCDHKAARFAVMHWHYSQAMPIGKLVRYGVWEDDEFIGAVLYGRGASNALGSPYGLDHTEVCELVRVALKNHKAPVSQIVAKTIQLLKHNNPNMRLVVSFADPEEGHAGGIYKAGNWIYTGKTASSVEVFFNNKWTHPRLFNPTGWGTVSKLQKITDEEKQELPRRKRQGKHRYLYPLDKKTRRQVETLGLPYPSAVEVSREKHGASSAEG
jgi:hypothetical protein